MTAAETPGEKPLRDAVFWTAVRAVYAAGVPVKRTCALFGIGRAALFAKGREEGWLRGAAARAAEQALVASIAAEVPGSEAALRLTDSAAPADLGPPDALIVPKALAAARLAIMRAAEAAVRGDDAAADVAVKLGERFARAASVLRRLAPALSAAGQDGSQDSSRAKRDAILRRIDQALEGSRTARRAEVEALKARGVDPREAWVWDIEDGDWVWDPGGAIARAKLHQRSAAADDAT